MDSRTGKFQNKFLHYFALLFKIFITVTVVVSLCYTISRENLAGYFPIKTVRVYGAVRANQQEIENQVAPLANKGFFTVNVDYIHDRLMQMPWVASIFVRRYWPDRIDIVIIEKNAVARWNDQSLISDSGEIFMPAAETFPAGIPELVGPEGQQIIMLQYFNQINQILSPLRLQISYLELTSSLSWRLMLNNGILIRVGYKDILTRLGHFVKVYPKIIGNRALDVQYIDLEYSNGLAVRWKQERE